MSFLDRFFRPAAALPIERIEPRASVQSAGGGALITTPAELEAFLQDGQTTSAGIAVTPSTAMRVAAVYGCVRILSSLPATLPLDVKEKVSENVRRDRSDSKLAKLLKRRPNRWQTPSQFKRMLTAHQKLEGNGYAMIVWSRGEPLELIPLQPTRVDVQQRDDLVLEYTYTRRDGRRVSLAQHEMLHLVGLTLDGFRGVTPLTYARETVGLALAQQRAGASAFKNGARASVVLSHPQQLGEAGRMNLKASLDEYRAGGESEGKALILEEGMKVEPLTMSAADAQWIESRKFSRSDIAMFFGVPPHMIGDTEKSTSWGSGIEQQTQGFLTFTAEDDLTMWEEAIARDLIPDPESKLYVRFKRAALVKGDLKTRTAAYASALQWGWMNPDDVRANEDMNPREDGRGGEYYDPPNTAGGAPSDDKDDEDKLDDPEKAA